jgi:hypothetical protein
MKVKYFRPDIFEIDSFLENKKIDPIIRSMRALTRAYMHVDRTGLFNPFNMMYDPIPSVGKFNKTFEDCCMDAATDLWKLGKPIELFWSGGIDSSGALIALLETKSESDILNIRYTKDSIVEFPTMWEKLVKDRNDPVHDKKMLDESLFENDDIIKVTGECADQLFCSGIMNNPEMTLDKLSKDWETIFTWDQSEFNVARSWDAPYFKKQRRHLTEILFAHVDIAPIEIVTIYDLKWWIQFCCNWQDVDSRLILTYTTTPHWQSTLSFYNTEDFQRWAITNKWTRTNRNKRYKETIQTQKQPAKDYINRYIKDDDYRKNKIKEHSLINILTGSIDEEYTLEFRERRRNNPKAIKLVLEDGQSWRRNEKVPDDIYKSILT